MDERREDQRIPAFEVINVLYKDPKGNERSFPIMLRDKSATGLGAVYVGETLLNPHGEYYFENEEGSVTRMRIVWITPLANHVYAIGFKTYSG
jgi:hypothetical protein